MINKIKLALILIFLFAAFSLASLTSITFSTILKVDGTNDISKELLRGDYVHVYKGNTVQENAEWAFAKFFLSPNQEVCDIAKETYEKGNILGTFIYIQCCKNGLGVLYIESIIKSMNFDLRIKLEKKSALTAVEAYIYSQLFPGNAVGKIFTETNEKRNILLIKFEKECIRLLEISANLGFAQAMNDLGNYYYQKKIYNKAYKLYEKAGKSGLAEGLVNQGLLLSTGNGVIKDIKDALNKIKESALAGNILAIFTLAECYNYGTGVYLDKNEARNWINLASDKSNHWYGYYIKGLALLTGNYIFERKIELGKEYFNKALETRNNAILYLIGLLYLNGNGFPQNSHKAVEFLEASYVQGNQEAAHVLNDLYREGKGNINPDEDLSFFWYQLSTNSRDAQLDRFYITDKYYITDNYRHYIEYRNKLNKIDPWQVKME